MFNVPQIQARLKGMNQQQLFQEGQANQNDALMFSLVNNENMNRQKAKQAMMAQQAGQQQPPVKQQDLMAMAPTPAPNMGAGIPLQGAGSPQQMGQNQLPEEQGIGALPAPNLTKLAGGGITGYADEGLVNKDPKQVFAQQYQGLATQVAQQLGVSPGVVIAHWGQESAWGKKPVGQYNFGNIKDFSGKGTKAFDKSEKSTSAYRNYDDPQDFANDYVDQIKRNFPKAVGAGSDIRAFSSGLQNGRLGQYASDANYGKHLTSTFNSILPFSPAQAETVPGAQPKATAPVSSASMIPGQSVKAPAYVAPQKGFFGNMADKMGISEDTQMNLGNLANAAAGATGATFIPSYLPRVGLGLAGLGEKIYSKFAPEAGAVGQKGIAELQAANKAAQVEKGVQGAQEAGSTLEEQDYIRKMMEANQQAQLPSKALELQNASTVRQATEAARMLEGANAARATAAGTAGVADLSNAMAQPSTPTTAPVASTTTPNYDAMTEEADREFGPKLQGTPTVPSISDITKTVTKPEGGRDWNDMLLNLGLGLMAGQSPYALQNLGTAGLGALKADREQKNQAMQDAYLKAKTLETMNASDPEWLKQMAELKREKFDPLSAYNQYILSHQKLAATPGAEVGALMNYPDFVRQFPMATSAPPQGANLRAK